MLQTGLFDMLSSIGARTRLPGPCAARMTVLSGRSHARDDKSPRRIWHGGAAAIGMYYLLPIVTANLRMPRALREWLPSIAGTAILEPEPSIAPMLSGAIAFAYVAVAIGIACIAQKRRDVG